MGILTEDQNRYESKPIILIGSQGTGKSTTARALSEKLGIPLIETDILMTDKNFEESCKNKPGVEVEITRNPNGGINYSSNEIIYGSHNSLFNEIVWFYPAGTPAGNPAVQNNRAVLYNYVENNWSIMSLARSSYADASTYDVPYATEYKSTGIPSFLNLSGATNTFGASTYYAQEVGNNEIEFKAFDNTCVNSISFIYVINNKSTSIRLYIRITTT